MIFSGIAAGASVFVDANTFVYHFMSHPTLGMACADLLARTKAGEVFAATRRRVESHQVLVRIKERMERLPR